MTTNVVASDSAMPRDGVRAPARQRFWSILLIGFFALAILTPAVVQLSGYGFQEAAGNRVLASIPEWKGIRELRSYAKGWEEYANDHFGFRSALVRLNSLARYAIGASSNPDVVIGRGGWLFYNYSQEKLLDQHTGVNVFSPDELEKWVQVMQANRDWLARRGIPFVILVAPDKSTIYPELLPAYPLNRGATTRLDQLVRRLEGTNLMLVDPRSALVKAKNEGQPVYYEGDSHWTQQGAWIAYQLLIQKLTGSFPNLTPVKLDDYSKSEHMISGDLVFHLGLTNVLKHRVTLIKHNSTHQISTNIRPPGNGWGWSTTFVTNNLTNAPRMMVFGDSFTSYVLGPTFLYETFRDPVYTHHSGGNFDFRLVDEVKPDFVLFELAERYLLIPPGPPLGF